MPDFDKRFALIRDGRPWYAVRIQEKGSPLPATFRISTRGKSRDARGEAEKLSDIELVAQKVLLEGKRMRCAPEGGTTSSLDLQSRGVQGYRLDPMIAKILGVSSENLS